MVPLHLSADLGLAFLADQAFDDDNYTVNLTFSSAAAAAAAQL